MWSRLAESDESFAVTRMIPPVFVRMKWWLVCVPHLRMNLEATSMLFRWCSCTQTR